MNKSDKNFNNLTPMMQQYLELKDEALDAFLFFRLGDFYELFFDDAKKVSKLLDIALTGRDCGLSERAPMCGVPFHAVDSYIAKLVKDGHKVAMAEQVGEVGQGLVRREIVRIVTPGTALEDEMLDADKNNYLLCVFHQLQERSNPLAANIGAAWTDISTGELSFCDIDGMVRLNELLARLNPSEIIANQKMIDLSINLSTVKYGSVSKFSLISDIDFDYSNALDTINSSLKQDIILKVKNKPNCVSALGALLSYVKNTQKKWLEHIMPNNEVESECLELGITASRTLEIFTNNSDGRKRGSLLWVMDKTSTSMGARNIKKWLAHPLKDENKINQRLDAIDELFKQPPLLINKIEDDLDNISDIERICSKISLGTIKPKDCINLANSLISCESLKNLILNTDSILLKNLANKIDNLTQLANLIKSAIKEDAPNLIREGGIIKQGFNKELDNLKNIKTNAVTTLDQIVQREKEHTGIKNLKIGFNRIFGYYLEISNSNKSEIPYRYTRKQTLANAERYITDEIKEIETKILNSESKALELELQIYEKLQEKIKTYLDKILSSAKAIASVDTIFSFYKVSKECGFIRPQIKNNDLCLKIIEGRHPIVEALLNSNEFTPNDTVLDGDEHKIMLITGPNMSGKSIYMRQVALISIMAHVGCYVPAKAASIPLIDKIFTRVGAGDDALSGRSTFMVEMQELSYILEEATDKSLCLLDEIGRGTSTYDGLSIAWAILEYLSNNLKAKVLFSTHYHELTDLENKLEGVKNYKLGVREYEGAIIFIRKLLRGRADKSFGIEVAALSGLKKGIINRAGELLKELEKKSLVQQKGDKLGGKAINTKANDNEIIKILSELDLDSVSPRLAYDILADLKKKV
ncbi:MAG: DNA mismatch repair protein MutS [Firmicutes bacterium]|nr:DNA mismatch repair protein MutS [Bacillota bacterium]